MAYAALSGICGRRPRRPRCVSLRRLLPRRISHPFAARLFSELLYRQRHPDLGDEVLARDGSVNGYDHYLKHGAREGRIGHLLFEPRVYHSQFAPDARTEVDAVGCYQHYLARIVQRLPEIRTSYCFDPVWYVRRYPAVAEPKWQCALHHYLTNSTPTEFDPLPEFSEVYYLQRNQDVAAAVEAKDRRNGYDHFLYNGAAELRSPCAAINLRHYVAANPSVRSEIEAGRARDAFVHYLAQVGIRGCRLWRCPRTRSPSVRRRRCIVDVQKSCCRSPPAP
jgi:hypothetical protein